MNKQYSIRGQTGKIIKNVFIIPSIWMILLTKSFSQSSDTTNYFPLQVGNKMIYQISNSCPPMPMKGVPDAFVDIRFVHDSIILYNKKYYEANAGHFEGGWDTLRVDSSNALIIYKKGKERTFYKFNAKVGDSWEYTDTIMGRERKFIVTLENRTDTVSVLSGVFKNCLKFHFKVKNSPEDEFYDYLAPNIGLVFRCRWESIGLYEAYIGNVHYTPNLVPDKKDCIADFKLYQNYPNPFNPSTVIKYEILKRDLVKLKIFDVLGKEIKSLSEKINSPGIYESVWDGIDNSGRKVPGGFYIVQLSSSNLKVIKKLLLIK
jgi:hypothetical protein